MLASILLFALAAGAQAEPDETGPLALRSPAAQRAPAAPHGLPAINGLSISTTNIRAGQTVSGSVETSVNVQSVEARVESRSAQMHRDAPGHFSLAYTVPWWLPYWLRHAYTLQIVARTVDGLEARREIGIQVR